MTVTPSVPNLLSVAEGPAVSIPCRMPNVLSCAAASKGPRKHTRTVTGHRRQTGQLLRRPHPRHPSRRRDLRRDKIVGGNGNNTPCGDEGNDVITGGIGNDTIFTLDGTTVVDDGVADTLWGDGGQDWFLIGSEDKIKDRLSGELVN